MTTLDVHKSVVGSESIVFLFLDKTSSVHTFVFMVQIEKMKKEHSDNVLCFCYTNNVFFGYLLDELLCAYYEAFANGSYTKARLFHINHKNADFFNPPKNGIKTFETSISQHQIYCILHTTSLVTLAEFLVLWQGR